MQRPRTRDPQLAEAVRPYCQGLAEVDGNRTRQADILDLIGFEDRDAHQDAYTSSAHPR